MVRASFESTAPGVYRFKIEWPTDGTMPEVPGYREPLPEKFQVHTFHDNVRLLNEEHAEQVAHLVQQALERDVALDTSLTREVVEARLDSCVRLAPITTPRPASYLVMDETDEPLFKGKDERNGALIFALVGVAIPIERADPIRVDLYRFLHEMHDGVGCDPKDIFNEPPELHGKEMLPPEKFAWATDEHRARCFEKVVDVVNREHLHVYRDAFYKRSVDAFTRPKEQSLAHGYESLMRIKGVERLRAASYVVPMVDGIDRKLFSGVLGPRGRFMSVLRGGSHFPLGPIHIKHPDTLMDPVFVDSAHSALMQLTDVVGYLLSVRDWEQRGWPLTPFKANLLRVAKTLDPELLHGHMGTGYKGVAPVEVIGARRR